MTLKKFLKDYNYAPYSMEEIALICTQIEDDNINEVAQKYLTLKHDFELVLIEIGFEFG